MTEIPWLCGNRKSERYNSGLIQKDSCGDHRLRPILAWAMRLVARRGVLAQGADAVPRIVKTRCT